MLFHVPKVLKSRQISHSQKHSTNFQVLMLTAATTTVLDTILNPCLLSFTTLSFSFLGTGAIIWQHQLDSFFNYLTKFSQKYKITCSALTVVGTFLLLDALSTPAQAQFFQTAETWMTGQFTGAEEAITLAFNVLRGLFILYLGISLVRVIQAARQDEDWVRLV
jgi:hypothetical protein